MNRSRQPTVAFLAYYFPPLVGIAAERAAAFVRHLPSAGWTPVVVAPRQGHYHRGAPSDSGSCTVIRTANPEISRLVRRVYGGWAAPDESEGLVRPVATGRVADTTRRWVREYLYVPDAQLGWVVPAFRALRQIIRDTRGAPQVAYSSSVPFSGHLAAGRAARAENVPWVAEYRDPWSTHDPAMRPRAALRRALDRRIDQWVVRTADHIVVTAESTKILFLNAFPWLTDEKVSVIPNGFEEADEDVAPPSPAAPLTLVHAGTLQAAEDAAPLVEALRTLHARQPGAVRLEVYGPPDPWLELAGMQSKAESWLHVFGLVSPTRAQKAMRASSVLVLLLPDARFRSVVSGKLMEYLGARRPVLAALPGNGSDSEAMLRAYGDGWVMRPYGTAAAGKALARLLDEHRQGRLQAPRVPRERVRALSRQALSGRLAEVFTQAWEGR